MEQNKKVLLSVKDLKVKFRVRGRILTAIRGISLDIYENESIAIVGESGSGKSVFTKTFAGMLDSNGYISQGKIIFNDEELADTSCRYTARGKRIVKGIQKKLDAYSKFELGADIYNKMTALKAAEELKMKPDSAETEKILRTINELNFETTEAFNYKQTLDPSKEKDKIRLVNQQIAENKAKMQSMKDALKDMEHRYKVMYKSDKANQAEYAEKMAALKAEYDKACAGEVSAEVLARNEVLAKEVYLSGERFGPIREKSIINGLLKSLKQAMLIGVDLNDMKVRNGVFDNVIFRVQYMGETENTLKGKCILNLAKIIDSKDWTQIRGSKIATVFQDPMTSLNPIITIGKQITSVILKHQNCTEVEARERALTLMKKVGIPNAEKRFDDYPFQYSGGMRQRIVIAIALSCQPKILICDEPTTALDVTIQAQILELLKDLQKEFNYTIVFITHDLGVVANVADRVAVLYAGQIVELGNVDEVFYDPRHPYTWALLSSLPQLAQRNTTLYSISGTPPSLYNQITGDPFAPRNPYCMKIDTLKEPPMFQVTDTHYAKTWLLDPRAPQVEKPEIIQNIHEKLIKAFNI